MDFFVKKKKIVKDVHWKGKYFCLLQKNTQYIIWRFNVREGKRERL